MKRQIKADHRRIRADYHPGNLTTDAAFKQDDAPPMSERTVLLTDRPVLYDADKKPIYRKVGFK